MITFMPPGTQVLTLRWFGATSNGREQDAVTTVTRQLIETYS